jgi:hypothetical protein
LRLVNGVFLESNSLELFESTGDSTSNHLEKGHGKKDLSIEKQLKGLVFHNVMLEQVLADVCFWLLKLFSEEEVT